MSRQSTRGRPHCSSSSAGSASYQGISGATSPVYHLPQEPYHGTDFGNSYRKKTRDYPYATEENAVREHHNYYNIHQNQKQQPCCNKESVADTHSYQYLTEREDRKSYGNIDNFSDDSSFYDYQRHVDRDKRYANHVYSEYESDIPIAHTVNTNKKPFQQHDLRYHSGRNNHHHNHVLKKENHLIVNQDCLRGGLDRVYPEAPLTRPIPDHQFRHESLPRRSDLGQISERANSPDSVGVGSAIVDGCGGHCVTFENVCSYVLQIFFVMGILIGVSLCIAGTVLRHTKSRDLQVLVYIGALSAMVSTLLLVVQCRVRRALRNRKRAVRMARTSTIPLADIRPAQQPLIHVPHENRPVIMPPNLRPQEVIADEQGVPWWRRNDHANNRV